MKKKSFILGFVLVFILLLSGCSSEQEGEKTMTCKRTMNQNGMKANLTYTVLYEGDYVNRVKSEETIETDATEILDAYKEQVETLYSPYKDIEYYEYSVDVKDNKLTSTVDIDYSKIDTDKLIEIDSANSSLIQDGKILVDDIKSLYEQLGATCE